MDGISSIPLPAPRKIYTATLIGHCILLPDCFLIPTPLSDRPGATLDKEKPGLDRILAEAKTTIKIYQEDNDIRPNSDWYVLKLHEEVGELTQALLRKTKRARVRQPLSGDQLHLNLENEAADVLGYLLLLADDQNIDIVAAARRKWFQEG